jgi:hypothetical protein
MLLVQLALGKAESIARMAGFGQPALGIVYGRLQLDQRRSCRRSTGSEMRTEHIALGSDGDHIRQTDNQRLRGRQVVDERDLVQDSLDSSGKPVGYIDYVQGVASRGGQRRPLGHSFACGEIADQQTGPSQVLSFEMVERINCGLYPRHSHGVRRDTEGGRNRSFVRRLDLDQGGNRTQQAIEPICRRKQR